MTVPLPLTMYLVAPVADQCEFDEDGAVNADLFVWARDPSEAVKLWRKHYERTDKAGTRDSVRVYEVPVMGSGATTSTIVEWSDVHRFGATTKTFSQD